jgi:hypothetical protein
MIDPITPMSEPNMAAESSIIPEFIGDSQTPVH